MARSDLHDTFEVEDMHVSNAAQVWHNRALQGPCLGRIIVYAAHRPSHSYLVLLVQRQACLFLASAFQSYPQVG